MQNRFSFLTKNKTVFNLFLFSIFIKIALAYLIPVVGDESYYWVWAQNLQLSYFDHPPAVAWLTSASHFLYNIFPHSFYALAIRLPFLLVSSVTFLIWLKNYSTVGSISDIGLRNFSILYFLNPFLGFGGILATPDIPLLLFWATAYFAVLKIRQTQKVSYYTLLGIALGLGFCSKYHIIFLPFSILVSLFVMKDLKSIQLKKLTLTFIFGLIFCLPVLIWNYQNNWSSFLFQLNHGLNAEKFNPSWPLTYLLGQILLFNPVLLFYILKNVRNSLSKNIAITQWAFFVFSSFKALVEANWPLTSHAQGLVCLDENFKDYFKASLRYWIGLWVFLGVLYFTPFGQQKFNRLPQSFAAQEIYQITKNYRPLYGPTYQMTSLLHLVSNETFYKLQHLSRFDLYDTIDKSHPTETTFYVLKYTNADWPNWIADYKLKRIQEMTKYELELYQVTRE